MDPLPLAIPKRDRVWLHGLLLLLTVITTTAVGALHAFAFSQGFGSDAQVAPPF